jgi:hypothetical protein
MINIIFLQVTILFIWFDTTAFEEYLRYISKDLFKIHAYIKEKTENDLTLTYHNYLKQFHNCFFIRLITCPICLNFWLSVIFSLYLSIFYIPIIFIVSLFVYYLLISIKK